MTQCDSRGRIGPSARLMSAAVFIGLALGPILAPADRAGAQGAVKSVHGDWQIRCDTPPGAQSEQCALMQSVTAEDRPNIGLTVIVLENLGPEEPADAGRRAARGFIAVRPRT